MDRLTKLEIQRVLLAGREIAWTNPSGKREAIELKDASQRRLFAYLLQSSVRDPKGLPEPFVSGISAASAAENDPVSETGETASRAQTGPWRLQKIETEGFGGINTFNGPAFSYEFDGESLILQGPNGSGKSSLVGAVLWAIAGERPRDHAIARAEDGADVYDSNNRKVGTWPPIACYPANRSDLIRNPVVRVTLTFVDPAGATALVERRLQNGRVSFTLDPSINLPEILIETGLLMPSRMPHIRIETGQTPLTRAVQSLTGLDDLIAIGILVDGLCHKGREYLSLNEKQVQHHKALFDTAVNEAQRAIKPTGETIEGFQPKDTANAAGAFAQLGKKLNTRAAELTQVISDDLVTGLNLTSTNVQLDVAGAITIAQEAMAAGLHELPTWKLLTSLGSALSEEVSARLLSAADQAEAALSEAVALDVRSQNDTRFQLKALGAHWHESKWGAAELSDCPLCEKPLNNLTLKTEIDALRRIGEAATRQFADNLNALQAALMAVVPTTVAGKLAEFLVLVPRQALIADLEALLISKPRIKATLATFAGLATAALASAPDLELPLTEKSVSTPGAIDRVRNQIAAVRRLVSLDQWRNDSVGPWQEWWRRTVGIETHSEEEPDKNAAQKETLTQHLARLSAAVGKAEPYRAAAEALRRAWPNGREAQRYEKIQDERELIAKQLAPLKLLGSLAEAQSRHAIETLSQKIGTILRRMHLSERLAFKSANLQRKAGLQVHGGFGEDFKIDATLVANTSWLRAVLWAFLFALRAEAVKQLGTDSLPLLVLDDPQATFDAEHRLRWAKEILALQQETIPVQVLLVTHDEIFVDLLKNVYPIDGRQGIIVSAGPALGHIGLFEGAALERKWKTTQIENTPSAAQSYISEVRVYVEGLLRLVLRGQAADVVWVTNGFVMGQARNKIRELHVAKLAPWDKSEFSTLAGRLDPGTTAVKFLEMSHHAGRIGTLTMAEAADVEVHWREKLEPALSRAFSLARDHFIIHGGLTALHAAAPACVFPEGYAAKVRGLQFPVLGRAAALTGGRVADGRVDLDFSTAPLESASSWSPLCFPAGCADAGTCRASG